MRFEWDERKALTNNAKHGVSFNEAASVFRDDLSWTYPDPTHSVAEQRWLTIGISGRGRVLVVSFGHPTEVAGRIRIISARKATRKERKFYEEG